MGVYRRLSIMQVAKQYPASNYSDWHLTRLRLEEEAYQRKQSERWLKVEDKSTVLSRTMRDIGHIRRSLDQDKDTKTEIRAALVAPRRLNETKSDKSPAMSTLGMIQSLKERLLTRFHTDIRKREIKKIERDTESAQTALASWGKDALKRNEVGNQASKLMRDVVAAQAANIKLNDKLEWSTRVWAFVETFRHNQAVSTDRPVTIEDFLATASLNPQTEPEISFDPQDVLDGIDQTESLNLRKIEFLCESSEANDKVQEAYNELRKQEKQLVDMKVQANLMNAQIERLTERSQELQFFCSFMSAGNVQDAGVSTEDEYLDLLQTKLRNTYRKGLSMGSIEFNMDALDVLESIETRVYELLDFQESSITPEKYRKFSKELEKMRRIQQKQQQDTDREKQQRDRNERATARMNQSVAKKGRRLMKRSLQEKKKKESDTALLVDNVDRDAEYFLL